MTKNDNPYLCGGIFFVLLLQIRKQRCKARDKFGGGNDGLADTDVLRSLVQVVMPHDSEPYKSSFSKNTSEYKSCQYSGGTYIPFNNDAVINSFDSDVKNNYSSALKRMSAFVAEYLDIINTQRIEWLVKAILATIEDDAEIKATDTFYIQSNGSSVSKKDISSVMDIAFQPFLLGVFHYIITNRPDNELGRKTYEAWHESPSSQGQAWKFKSNIGANVVRPLNISLHTLSDESTQTTEEIPEMDVQYNDSINNHSIKVINQYINNPTVVNQYGEKIYNIQHVDHLD